MDRAQHYEIDVSFDAKCKVYWPGETWLKKLCTCSDKSNLALEKLTDDIIIHSSCFCRLSRTAWFNCFHRSISFDALGILRSRGSGENNCG